MTLTNDGVTSQTKLNCFDWEKISLPISRTVLRAIFRQSAESMISTVTWAYAMHGASIECALEFENDVMRLSSVKYPIFATDMYFSAVKLCDYFVKLSDILRRYTCPVFRACSGDMQARFSETLQAHSDPPLYLRCYIGQR